MTWFRSLLVSIGVVAACAVAEAAAAPPVTLAGRWTLNRELSEFPKEVGFGVETPGGESTQSGQAGRQGGGGRRGGGGGSRTPNNGGFSTSSLRESEEDANKIKELVADAKNPPAVLVISQTDTTVVITGARDRTHAFRPNGREDVVDLDSGPVVATAKWSGAQLGIQLTVEGERVFRYLYSRLAGGQLLVETRLEEGRSRDKAQVIKRVYDPE
jgi:hypothetical protein